MHHRCILCIDDDPFYRDLYKTVLRTRELAAEEADSLRDGLEKALTVRPALIILDIMMPETGGIIDGYGLLRIFREREETKSTPVLMVSSLNQQGDIDYAVGLGASAYITKQELTPQRLLEEIDRFLADAE